MGYLKKFSSPTCWGKAKADGTDYFFFADENSVPVTQTPSSYSLTNDTLDEDVEQWCEQNTEGDFSYHNPFLVQYHKNDGVRRVLEHTLLPILIHFTSNNDRDNFIKSHKEIAGS